MTGRGEWMGPKTFPRYVQDMMMASKALNHMTASYDRETLCQLLTSWMGLEQTSSLLEELMIAKLQADPEEKENPQ